LIKKFSEWLTEEIEIDSKVKSPVSIEIITGNVRHELDPQEEGWASQIVHLDDYESLMKDVQKAISEKDVKQIEKLIGKAKETPLFKKEPLELWNQKEIELKEPMRSDADFNLWVARYIVNKLGVFISWCKNNKEK
jgi:hypothetical protein